MQRESLFEFDKQVNRKIFRRRSASLRDKSAIHPGFASFYINYLLSPLVIWCLLLETPFFFILFYHAAKSEKLVTPTKHQITLAGGRRV